jgi:hypothetical protein
MQITLGKNTYSLENADKVRRVLQGEKHGSRVISRGLGNKADPKDIIAEYDKRGGLITGKEGQKVKTGCFWDFEERKAFASPKVVYTFRVNGEIVEIEEGQDVPMNIQAAVTVEKKKKGKK